MTNKHVILQKMEKISILLRSMKTASNMNDKEVIEYEYERINDTIEEVVDLLNSEEGEMGYTRF